MADTNFDSVVATTFTGALVGNVTGNVTGGTTGAVTASSVANSGTQTGNATVYAAAGATQGTATLIGAVLMAIITATASSEGVRLPTAATGRMVYVTIPGTVGTKVYPFSGDKIDSTSTNGSVNLAAGKGNLYYAKNTSQWYTAIKGA